MTLFSLGYLLLISLLVLLLVYKVLAQVLRKNKPESRPVLSNDFSSKLILDDLTSLIHKECEKVYTLNYSYQIAKFAGSMEHSKLNFSTEIVSNVKLEELVESTTIKILDMISPSYRDRLSLVIYETQIDDYILEEVHLYLFAKTLNLNTKNISSYSRT